MKVVVIGTRGIPGIPGGVETHCEELYPRLVQLGCEVTVMRRSCYVTPQNQITDYKGVHLIDVYAPRRKSLEAIVHSTLAVFKAWRLHPDVLHVHAIGPALVIPLARLLGMRVVATNHGPDYDRQKWGRLAKAMLQAGEWCQAHLAHRVIAISHVIVGIMRDRYGRTRGVDLIYNGAPAVTPATSTAYVESLGLRPRKYVVAVARFVPEKRLDLLVTAFSQLHTGYRLVLAGDADHADDYSTRLKQQAREAGVVLTGYIRGERMRQIMTHAALFVLPSTHEGLPISMLEAMSYRLDVLASDIPANRLPELKDSDFFHVNDLHSLTAALQRKLTHPQLGRAYDMSRYNWDTIAAQTLETYRKALR